MDAANDPLVREINAMLASQTAKTEILNNIVGYHISRDPCPMLGVWPTDRMATTWSKDRLGPMLRDTPCLRGLIFDRANARRGSGSSEILEKKFPGGLLAMSGANSAAGLAMRPVRIVYCDETDRFPASAGGRGGDEGDPIELAGKRTSNYADSLHVNTSSPGVRGRSKIAAKYDQSDRNRWWVPCPHCSHEQVLRWEGVDFRDAELPKQELERLSNEERAKRALYKCEKCGEHWNDAERHEAAARGRWIADNPGVKERRGFTVNALVSPWLTLSHLVEEWLSAQGDPMALQVFVNTRLAELWDEGGERLQPELIHERCEKYPTDVPAGVLLLTAGVDVQKASLEVTVWGWGVSGEAWAIEHHVLSGDPATLFEGRDDTRLDDVLLRHRWIREDGAPMRLAGAAVDTGGEYFEEVLAYCNARRRRNVFAIKGRAGETVPLWPLRATKIKQSKRTKARGELYVLGVDNGKSALHASLRRDRPEDWKPGDAIPGFLHFPQREEFDAEWFAQLAGETPRPRRQKGRISVDWIQDYPRVEACDCFVYARAVQVGLKPNWKRLASNIAKRVTDPEPDPDPENDPPKAPKPKPARRRRPGGFVKNYR
jgi:phage terminase large subunit GpA-like protein